MFPRMVIKIPAGYVGVIFRPFSNGVDLANLYGEGVHILFPFNHMSQYSIALNVHKLELEVLTADLLKSKVKVSFQFAVSQETLPLLHRYVGSDYLVKLIIPEVTASTREMFGKLTSSQAFTRDLRQVARDISINADNALIDKLSPPGLTSVRLVRISSFQLESITFPPEVQVSIDNKVIASTNAEAMDYKILSTRKEAVRKVIEAEGVKKYQDIVNAGLTDQYLKLRGIEATEKLAESNNAKVVIFGSSSSGLPLILGDLDPGRAAETLARPVLPAGSASAQPK